MIVLLVAGVGYLLVLLLAVSVFSRWVAIRCEVGQMRFQAFGFMFDWRVCWSRYSSSGAWRFFECIVV